MRIALYTCATALLGLVAGPAWAHDSGAVRGTVVDGQDGSPVEGAFVALPENQGGVPTDRDGRFRLLDLHPGSLQLTVTRLGYAPRQVQVEIAADRWTRVTVELHPQPIPLARTLVQTDRAAPSAAAARPVREFDLRTRPLDTPRQLLQVVPGLTTTSGSGGRAERIFLRGFDNGFGTDVAFAVDGVPVNLVSHGHGQGYADLHFLIPAVVDAVDVYKGPYFAQYGNLANAAQVVVRTATHLHDNRIEARLGSFGTRGGTLLYQLPTPGAQTNAYFAGDLLRSAGPADMDEAVRRLSLFSRLHHRFSETATLDVSLTGYAASWRDPGLVAGRAVDRGDVSRRGSHDDEQGGTTNRQSAAVTYRTQDADGRQLETTAWWVGYDAELFSNVTFYLLDPIYGDMVEQADHRNVVGLQGSYRFSHRMGPVAANAAVGGGLRADDIDLDTWQVVAQRRYWPLLEATVHERNHALWGEEELVLTPALRLTFGLRHDRFAFDVDDALEIENGYVIPWRDRLRELRLAGKAVATTGGFLTDDAAGPAAKAAHIPLVQPHASGVATAARTSPKAGLVWSPTASLDLFANGGLGFHSNDARAVVLGRFVRQQSRVLAAMGATPVEIDTLLARLNFDPRQRDVSAVPRTRGAELGLRWRLRRPGVYIPRAPLHQLGALTGGGRVGHYPTAAGGLPSLPIRLTDRLNLGAALWWIDVDEEFIYDTDLARPELLGPTRRHGVDLEARAQLRPWLWADADLNWAHGRLRDAPAGADRIPLAPRWSSAGGLTARGRGWDGSLRWRHLGERPATPAGDLTATGHVLVDATCARERAGWRLELALGNLLGARWREAQVPLVTILPGEGDLHIRGPLPDPEIHYTAGAGRQLDVRLARSLE